MSESFSVPAAIRGEAAGVRNGGAPVWGIWLLFAAVLLGTLALQLPGIADFQKFGFYDEGAWMHLDEQVARGAVPTVDIGYSYGAVALLASRAWFAVFGRTPWAFIGFVMACNLAAAWGVARILAATGSTWKRAGLACVILPLAIMPNNYSLMHPLEMMLIILALAQQARGRYGWALAIATVALLTKPSMAYVLGFLLLVMAAWVGGYGKKFWRVLALPAVVGAAVFAGTVALLGWTPAIANILPLKAAAAYDKMGFGIFRAGMDFWWHGGDARELFGHYVTGPATFWIAASLVLWTLGLIALVRMARRATMRPSDPLVAMLALLHAAFVFKFYGWEGSWTYYSYLPVLGVLVGLRGGREVWLLRILVVVGGLGLLGRFNDGFGRWWGMQRVPDCGGLWVYNDELDESRKVRAMAAEKKALFLVNGTLSTIWPEAKTPPVWFLSPGILLDKEFDTVRQEMRDADLIVLYAKYDPKQEAWAWEEFAKERALFEDKPVWEGKYYLGYRRKGQ